MSVSVMLVGRMRLLSVVSLAVLLGASCSEGRDPLQGPLRVSALPDAGDTVRWLVEGLPTGVRLLRPEVDISISALDAAGDEPLSRVRTVIGLRSGATVVYDEAAAEIALFDPSGRFVRRIGRTGAGPGEYGAVYGMTALPTDQVVLWDGSGARINVYHTDGSFQRQWSAPPTGLSGADGITSDADGGLYLRAMLRFDPAAPDQSVTGVVRWDSLGVHDSIPFPRWNAAAPALRARASNGMMVYGGSVPYVPRDHHRILPNGALVTGPGDPYQLTLVPRGGGRPLQITRAHVPVPISSGERDAIRDRIEAAMRGIEPAWSWNGPAIPVTKPAYAAVAVDREGRVWILLPSPTQDAPQREASAYDVYGPDGAPIARVALPDGARFASATRTQLWMVRSDSLGVPIVERARLRLPEPLQPPR